jgi:hypothetical protein
MDKSRGLYIGKYPRPHERGEYQLMSFGGKKYEKGKRKQGKCKINRKKGERRRKGKRK